MSHHVVFISKLAKIVHPVIVHPVINAVMTQWTSTTEMGKIRLHFTLNAYLVTIKLIVKIHFTIFIVS